MKEFIKLSIAFVIGFAFGLFIQKTFGEPDVEYVDKQVVVDHYITTMVADTVYLDHYDTVTLHKVSVDTAFYTLYDSVMVQVPISKYEYDTTLFQGDTVKTQIKAVLSGFDVRVGQLSTHTEITQNRAVSVRNKGYNRFGLGLYFGYGANKQGLSPQLGVGVMYRLL